MQKLEVLAVLDNLEQVFDYIHEGLKDQNMSDKNMNRLDVAVEEIFTNIATYAYNPEKGPAKIVLEILEDPLRVEILFSDQGKPYNPLEQEDVNVQEKMEQREVGGLGLYLVRKYTDGIRYEYKDGQNMITIEKLIQTAE